MPGTSSSKDLFFVLFVLLTLISLSNPNMLTAQVCELSFEANPNNRLNSIFRSIPRFMGGDGMYTVPLNDGRTLMIFGDTFIDDNRQMTRKDSRIINNSLAISMELLHSDVLSGRSIIFPARECAEEIFRAKSAGEFYWPLDGITSDGKLYLFAVKIRKTDDDAFGFKEVGNSLFIINNYLDPVSLWKIEEKAIPHSRFGIFNYMIWGSATMADGDEIYVYGVYKENDGTKSLVTARAPHVLEQFDDWRFFSKKIGYTDKTACLSKTLKNVPNEFSVSRFKTADGFLLICSSGGGMGSDIQAFMSKDPFFLESSKHLVYSCPESDPAKGVFAYSAKAVKPLSGGDSFTVVYFTNCFDFNLLFQDKSLYWPTFVDVKASMLSF